MTNFETTTHLSGNLSILDRGIRIGLGLTVLFWTLHFSVSVGDAYSITKLVATVIVLTGIAGWDPFYASFRDMMSRKLRTKSYAYVVRRRYL